MDLIPYLCTNRHNKGSLRPESDLSNWIRPARAVERLVNSNATTTLTNAEGFVGLRFNFVANGTVTTGTTVTDTNGLGTVTHNLNTSGFGGGGGLDYGDPKTLVRLITQAEGKTLTFTNGLPDTAVVRLRNADDTADLDYFVDYTFTDGLPSQINYYVGSTPADAIQANLRAVKRLMFVNGLPQTITIGAT